jgi:hypothetical protein
MSVVRALEIESLAHFAWDVSGGMWSMQRRFRGWQHCEHLTASTRAGQNDGMDFVLRDLRHLTHVPERGLNVLVGPASGSTNFRSTGAMPKIPIIAGATPFLTPS